MKVKLRAGEYFVPVEIIEGGGRLTLVFGYTPALISEVKAMEGAKYHGYDEKNPRKVWSVKDNERNKFQLAYLSFNQKDPTTFNPYTIYDSPLIKHNSSRPLFPHQGEELIPQILQRKQCIVAAEMGCVAGDTIVHVNRAGKGFQITLAKLYKSFNGRRWNSSISTNIRVLGETQFKQHPIIAILYKGKKKVFKLTLKSGKSVKLTPDHEVAINYNTFKPLMDLKINDVVLSNGKFVDKDGYVRLWVGKGQHPREWFEHILVAEAKLGRSLAADEHVHHINGIRHDNRLENLEVMHYSKHGKLHANVSNFNRAVSANGGICWFVPIFDEISSIEEIGEEKVYDVICQDPYRNFVANGVVVHNCGKTLAAAEAMEKVKFERNWDDENFLFVCKKNALEQVVKDFEHWKIDVWPKFVSYNKMVQLIANWPQGKPAPRFVVFDESSALKSPTAKRTEAAQHLADSMRKEYGQDCYIILMSGSPSPKNPADWWAQCEVACPGFLKEGSYIKFQKRLALIEMKENELGQGYPKLVTWLNDETKCAKCGKLKEDFTHNNEAILTGSGHLWVKSINEITKLYSRMKGLVLVKLKKDCLKHLPPKQYRLVRCKPTRQVLNAATIITKKASRAIEALTLLRELSDGFQYINEVIDTLSCPDCASSGTQVSKNPEDNGCLVPCDRCEGRCIIDKVKRGVNKIPCPKDDALREIIEDHEDIGRLVIYGGFTGSVDRITDVVLGMDWKVVRLDGRGWYGFGDGMPIGRSALYSIFGEGQKQHPKVALVAQASSAGFGLNFTASPTQVFYSNDFNFEARIQAEDRNHRPGIEKLNVSHVNIIDIVHLDSDLLILKNHEQKRQLQAMTMGELLQTLNSIASENMSGQRIQDVLV